MAKKKAAEVIEKPVPVDGMVNIHFQGKIKSVTWQLAETLIKKGAATYFI